MLVKVKDIRPNPFRNINAYPLSQTKIDLLIGSINKTGFWDNILARKKDGNIELAYGHHRFFALQDKRSGYGKDAQIDIPVKDISDDDMLRIMADENMDEYSPAPKVVNETVRAVRDYLRTRAKNPVTIDSIYKFMGAGWSKRRIEFALREVELIDKGVVEKEAIEILPTQRKSSTFTSHVSRMKTTHHISIPKHEQLAVAKTIKEEDTPEEKVEDVFHRKSPTYRQAIAASRPRGMQRNDIDKINDLTKLIEKSINALQRNTRIVEAYQDERCVSQLYVYIYKLKSVIDGMTADRNSNKTIIINGGKSNASSK